MRAVRPVSVKDVAVADAGKVTAVPSVAVAGATSPTRRRIVTPGKSRSVGFAQFSVIELSVDTVAFRAVTGPGAVVSGGIGVPGGVMMPGEGRAVTVRGGETAVRAVALALTMSRYCHTPGAGR